MATLYFNAAVDTDWATLGNWWTDDTFTTQATALPDAGDSVIASGTINSNNGSNTGTEPTVVNFTTTNDLGIGLIVTGVATFNGSAAFTFGTITGNCTFNEGTLNQSTITGNATFNDISYNLSTITGNATFSAESFGYNTGRPLNPATGVSGTITFSSASPVAFYLNNENWTANTTNWVFTTAGQNWYFDNYAYNSGTITGACAFDNNSYNSGTITGACTFLNYAYNSSGSTVTGNCTFDNYAYNSGTITGNASFTNNPWSGHAYANQGTVTGNATFNENAGNDTFGIVGGSATFTGGTAINAGALNTVAGTSTFNWSSENRGTIGGPATFNDQTNNSGTVNNSAVFNHQAVNVFSISYWWWGGENRSGIVNGNAIFNGDSINSGEINGNVTFNDNAQFRQSTSFSFNGQPVINGNAVFKNNSSASGYGPGSFYFLPIVNGNCTFENNSFCEINEGSLRHQSNNGTVTFRDAATNRSGLSEWGGRIVFAPARGINGTSILGAI